jgi:hypothetical protein
MLSRYLLLGSFLALSCQGEDTSFKRFSTNSKELINLITNKERTSEAFIKKWELTPCEKKSEVAPLHYSVQGNAIEFEVTPTGYIIGINNLLFENYDSLKTELSRTHRVLDKQELIRQNAKYDMDGLVDINMYIGEGYDLVIASTETAGKASFSIVGNSGE